MTLIRTLNEDTNGGRFPLPTFKTPFLHQKVPMFPLLVPQVHFWSPKVHFRSTSLYQSHPVHGHRMWRHAHAHWANLLNAPEKILVVSHIYTTFVPIEDTSIREWIVRPEIWQKCNSTLGVYWIIFQLSLLLIDMLFQNLEWYEPFV